MIRVCLVAPAHMTGGQAVEARTLLDGFAQDADIRVELQPIDPPIPAALARVRGLRTLLRLPLFYGSLVRRVLRADVVQRAPQFLGRRTCSDRSEARPRSAAHPSSGSTPVFWYW